MRDEPEVSPLADSQLVGDLARFGVALRVVDVGLPARQVLQRAGRDGGLDHHGLQRCDERVAPEQRHEPWQSGRGYPVVSRRLLLVEAQRGKVFDRALIGELEAEVRGFDLRDRQLPAARLEHRVRLLRMERAALREGGTVIVRGQKVVLEADAPFLARHKVDRDAQRAVRVRHARFLFQCADQAAADEVGVLIARLEAVRAEPPSVEVSPALPGAIADLEQVGEVALQRDLDQHGHRSSRERVQRDVLVHLMQVDQPVDGDGDARLAHVASRPGDVVGDHVPARLAK